MTTIIPFTPSIDAPFQFQLTLDGQPYTAIITWNVFGQRYYVNIYAADGTRVLTQARIDSMNHVQIGALTTVLGSRYAVVDSGTDLTSVGNGTVLLSSSVNVGTTISAVEGLNLLLDQPAIVTGTDTAAQLSNDINMVGGYFLTSSLVYRAAATQFEVSP